MGCQCPHGMYGRRCEFRDVVGGGNYFLPMTRHRVETASMSGGVCLLVGFTVLVTLLSAMYKRRRRARVKSFGTMPTTAVGGQRPIRRDDPVRLSISEYDLQPSFMRQIPAEYVV